MLRTLLVTTALASLLACQDEDRPGIYNFRKTEGFTSDDVVASVPVVPAAKEAEPAPAPPPAAPPAPVPDLRAQALAILDKSCTSCHNPNNAQGNFANINNVEDMIAGGRYIVPGASAKSLLYTRMAPGGNMPPSGLLKDEEIQIVRKWIDGLQVTTNRRVTENEILALVRKDVEQNLAAAQKHSTRYFSLHVPSNLGTDQESLNLFRQAFSKVLNSFSKSPTILKPVAIDAQKLVYRVTLDDIAMRASLFDGVVKDFYPFTQTFVNVGQDKDARRAADDGLFLKTELGADNFLLRLDWFVATAPLPDSYARLLELGADQTILDAQLGVDIAQDVIDSRVVRSGFKNSGVSTQNRVIERHVQKNGLSYWQSYDFAANDGFGNIFNLPLGPLGVGQDGKAFHHDGGEIIFQLPNGMFGYYLSNAAGVALDKGPTSIVKQNDAPPQFLTAIVNGLSCMTCHNQGLINKKDEIRDFAKANSNNLSNAELAKLFELYPETATFNAAMDKDNAVYKKAALEMGLDPTKPDPVSIAYRYYNRALSRSDVREELGISDAALKNLLAAEPFRSQWTSLAQTSGFIKRDEFNSLVGEALEQFKPQVNTISATLGDMVITASCMFANPLQMDGCLLRAPAPAPVAAD